MSDKTIENRVRAVLIKNPKLAAELIAARVARGDMPVS